MFRTYSGPCLLVMASLALPVTAHGAPIIHWKLDESAGTSAADSAAAGGAQPGTSGNAAPQWQPAGGIIGGALRMTPTAQADVDENVTFTSASGNIVSSYPFTLGSWVNTTSNSTFRETFLYFGNQTQGAEYAQTSKEPSNSAANPNRAVAAARNTTFVGAAGGLPINDGQWHHVVGVYDSATSRTLYVDGQSVATSTTSVLLPTLTRFSAGALMRPAATDSFNGMLDDVAVWDESLSPVRVGLLNGLGRFSAVALDDPSVSQVELVFNTQSGSAQSGPYAWQYATGLPGGAGATGMIGSDPYIVLDAGGNGVRGVVPEPGAAGLALAALGLLARRRRARVKRPGRHRGLHGVMIVLCPSTTGLA